jgi:hypothetical protein
MLSWPSSSFTAMSETPRMTRWLANVCLSPCVVIRFASCAFVHVEGTTSFTRVGQPAPVRLAEDVGALQVPVLLEHRDDLVGQRYLPVLRDMRSDTR